MIANLTRSIKNLMSVSEGIQVVSGSRMHMKVLTRTIDYLNLLSQDMIVRILLGVAFSGEQGHEFDSSFSPFLPFSPLSSFSPFLPFSPLFLSLSPLSLSFSSSFHLFLFRSPFLSQVARFSFMPARMFLYHTPSIDLLMPSLAPSFSTCSLRRTDSSAKYCNCPCVASSCAAKSMDMRRESIKNKKNKKKRERKNVGVGKNKRRERKLCFKKGEKQVFLSCPLHLIFISNYY